MPGVVFADIGTTPEGDFTFRPPLLNNTGQVAFIATLGGPGTNRGTRGAWIERNGTLELVTKTGTAAPGLTTTFTSIDRLAINDGGQIALTTRLLNGREAIWSKGDDGLELVAQSGSPAPGTEPGVNFGPFVTNPILNERGELAFYTLLAGDRGQGVWAERGGSLELIASSGQPAPGTPEGVTFSKQGFSQPAFNDNGSVAFRAGIVGSGVRYENDRGIWTNANGALTLVVRSGSQAPGGNAEERFSLLGDPRINSTGHVVFNGYLEGSGITDGNDVGLWKQVGSDLQLVVREGPVVPGIPAPGAGPDVNFSSISSFSMNDAGHLLIKATTTGPGVDAPHNEGFWVDRGDGYRLLCHEGMQAPGLNPGVRIEFSPLLALTMMNESGRFAMRAQLSGDEIDGTNDLGIWAIGEHGLELVVRTGQLLEVAPGDQRTVASFASIFQFNDRGQTAFLADFTDGTSGVFVAELGAVPEPAGWCIMLAAIFSVTTLDRRPRIARI